MVTIITIDFDSEPFRLIFINSRLINIWSLILDPLLLLLLFVVVVRPHKDVCCVVSQLRDCWHNTPDFGSAYF